MAQVWLNYGSTMAIHFIIKQLSNNVKNSFLPVFNRHFEHSKSPLITKLIILKEEIN
jgi:ribosomal protein S17E